MRIPYYFLRDRYIESRISSKSSLESYQSNQIKHFLKQVCAHSSFYQKFSGQSLDAFPIMNKEMMSQNLSLINTAGLNADEMRAFILEQHKKSTSHSDYKGYTVGLSSGTTGRTSLFVLSPKERDIWSGIMLSKALKGLPLQKHKVAFCFRNNNNLYKNIKNPFIDIMFIDIANGAAEIVEDLLAYQPTILLAPARVLSLLPQYMNKNAIQPKRVFSVAECLEEDSADRLKSYFKQDISEIYQCTEGFLGITDPASGKIVLNEMYIHVEKEWIDEKRFIPIITDFTRFTQPFIRYRLSDILVESENNDGIFTEIKKIEGRLDDILYFRMKNTDSLKPIFPDTIRELFTQITELEDYIVAQNALRRLTIMIKPYNEELAKLILSNLQNFILTNNISPIEMQCETLDIHDLNIKKRRIKSNFKLKEGLK